MEVNGTGLAVVLRCEIWEDSGDWLAIWDNWRAAVGSGGGSSGSRSGGDNAGGVGVAVCLTTCDQRSSIGKSAEAEDGSEDVGRGETGGSGHFI